MILRWFLFIVAALVVASGKLHGQGNAVPRTTTNAPALVPLPLRIPHRTLTMHSDQVARGPDIEPFTNKRPGFLAPMGVTNVALGKKVIASVVPYSGSLSGVTDGNKEQLDSAAVEFKRGIQSVQIDLGTAYEISAVVFWLDYRYPIAFRGVIVAVADDESFTRNVRVLFNNDRENLAGMGAGTDKRYVETNRGKLVDAKGEKARYVRIYSNGSNASGLNCFMEVEVWALPSG